MSQILPFAKTASDTSLADRFLAVRQFSRQLVAPLAAEDCCLQSMPEASPTRWHLAHTTWFFEQFVLGETPEYEPFHEYYEVLFNSYYNSVGEQFPRPRRGMLSRPTVAEIMDYRDHVEEALLERIASGEIDVAGHAGHVIELGLQHEQQHQELILTDLKHLFSFNPLLPAYQQSTAPPTEQSPRDAQWIEFDEGIHEIGYQGDRFAYDNEGPVHRVLLEPYCLASRPVVNREYCAFIDDGGYERPELWLSLGWNWLKEQEYRRPLYWRKRDDRWHEFTLAGLQALNPEAPATHLNYFEADAYARWADARLPTEFEWEVAAHDAPLSGNFADVLLEAGRPLHPQPAPGGEGLEQMFGDVWEWTASPYTPYRGYKPVAGALGEYNGKFMCNQYVLRGGSVATHSTHIRQTYRNFFGPEYSWQFSGLRLARDA